VRLSVILLERMLLPAPPYTVTPVSSFERISLSLTREPFVLVIRMPARIGHSVHGPPPPPLSWITFPRTMLYGPATQIPARAFDISVLLNTVVALPVSMTPEC